MPDEGIPVGLAKTIVVSGVNMPIQGVLTPVAMMTFTLETEGGEEASFAFALRVNAATTVAEWLTSIAKGLQAQAN